MAFKLLTLFACSMAGDWGATDGDPTVGDDTAPGDSADGDTGGSFLPSLALTELMVDPDAVSDDLGEWFELTNTGTTTVDLDGANITGPGEDAFAIVGSLLVSPGGRLVFAVAGDITVNGGITPDYVYTTKALKLSNEGGTLSLIVGDAVVDSVTWDTLPLVEGHTISLDPGALDPTANDAAASWCPAATPYGAGDYGTPGAANDACTGATDDADGDGVMDAEDCAPTDGDVYPGADETPDGKDNDCDGWTDERPPVPGDLVVTEIMDDPDPTDDDTGEWFEILNVSGVPILLIGVEMRDADGESFAVDVDAVIAVDALLVFGSSDDTDKNGGINPDILFDDEAFHLGNDEDEVILLHDGVVIDEVVYDADFPHEKGKSRSLDPAGMSATENDASGNWCEGDGAYGADGNQGTPGETNDDCP